MVSGRIIFLPAINLPAVLAGRRTSPVDGLNLNRTFPGDPTGTITQQISAYVSDVVMPLGDAYVDLHSGGSSLNILPSAIIEPAPDRRSPQAQHRRRTGLRRAAHRRHRQSRRTAHVDGDVGAGRADHGRHRDGWRRHGFARRARHLPPRRAQCAEPSRRAAADRQAPPVARPENILRIPGHDGYVLATADGVFEPFHALGATVHAGEDAGRIHNLGDPGRTPETVRYLADGIVYGRRQPGRVVVGNCCVTVAARYEGELA